MIRGRRTVQVNVVLADAARPSNDVLESLRSLGFEVIRVLDRLGVVTGRIEKRRMPALAHTPGVKRVSEDRGVVAAHH